MTKDQRDDALYLALDGYDFNGIAKKLNIPVTEELKDIYWDAQTQETQDIVNDIKRLQA